MKKSAPFFSVLFLILLLTPLNTCQAQGAVWGRVIRGVVKKSPRYGGSFRNSYRFTPKTRVYKPRTSTIRSGNVVRKRMTYGKSYRSYQGLKRKYSLNNAAKIKLNHKRLGTIKRQQASRALGIRKNKERLLARQRTAELNREKELASLRANAAKKNQTAKTVRERKKANLDHLKKKQDQAARQTEKKTIERRNQERKKKTLAELQKEKQRKNNLQLEKNRSDLAKVNKEVRKYWKKETTFRGVKVYQRDDIFDIKKTSSWRQGGETVTGTNLERMKTGRAPIANDGKSVNIHHMVQKDASTMAEMTSTFHKKNHKAIHINPSTLPSAIDRKEFNAWRNQYWKNRAAKIMKANDALQNAEVDY